MKRFSLNYLEEFSGQTSKIAIRREHIYQGLKNIDGVRPFPSRTKVIF
jgi:hypothetical protein